MSFAFVVSGPSRGARTLARSIGLRRVQPERAALLRHRSYINWGCSSIPDVRVRVINRPEAVRRSISKRATFEALSGKSYLPVMATSLPAQRDSIWLARRDGLSSGRGITVIRRRDAVPEADMYVRYIKKSAEYRVHVVNGEVILVQQKRRADGVERDENQLLIRSHANGWVYTVNNVRFASDAVRERLNEVALDAVHTLGLDFAAVDLIVEKGTDNVFFLETNTKPGIEGETTRQAYHNKFSEIVGANHSL